VVFFTAWQTLVARAQLQPGEWVIVHAAGSGVGIAGIQLAKYFGGKVITTAGSTGKLQRAAELGADLGINYDEGDFAAEALKATEGKGVDVIIDGIGGATFNGNLACLAPRGRLVVIGQVGGGSVNLDLGRLLAGNMALHGFYLAGLGRALFPVVQQFQKELLPLFAEGKLRSVVDHTFPLADAAEAQRYVAGRKNFGKVVLIP
jgi:NADPH:quinone reductase-like Zn-dependent oxidoreductase